MDYFLIYKPFGMISQFSKDGDKPTLKDLSDFPIDVYPVGRLDTDSEGLLVLTNDKTLNNKILNPDQNHDRTYWIQVEGVIDETALEKLRTGVNIRIKKREYTTRPAEAKELNPSPDLPPRVPPIRDRQSIPTSWIELKLHEGKNRQVRRMTAKVGFPTLRLVRYAIENLTLETMIPGEVKRLTQQEIEEFLNV